MADYGFVYCMGNECMPGVFKIGKTSRSVLVRAQELSSSTSVPIEFDVLFYIETPRMSHIEAAFHEHFDHGRVSENREFFRLDLDAIQNVFDEYAKEEGIPMAFTNIGLGLLAEADMERKAMDARINKLFVDKPSDVDVESISDARSQDPDWV